MIDRFKNFSNSLSNVVLFSMIICLIISYVIMVLLFLLGILKLFIGIYFEISNLNSSENEGILKMLVGLEFIFIAPIAYLLFMSLTKYLFSTKPEINPDLVEKQRFIKHAMLEIGNVKLYVTGLLISILLVHSMKLIFQEEMSFLLCICIIFILITLILYYYILHKTGDHK